jgi:hypothetical protein
VSDTFFFANVPGTADPGYDWGLYQEDNTYRGYVRTDDVAWTGLSNTTVDTTRWDHVGLVYDGATISLYVNGVVDAATGNQTGNVADNGYPTILGMWYTPNWIWNGAISDACFWNQALSPGQIHQLYQSQLNGGPGVLGRSTRQRVFVASAAAPTTYVVPTRIKTYPKSGFDTSWELNTEGPLPVPVAYYGNKFTGGQTWFDLSGRGNHGTLTNDAAWGVRERGPDVSFDGTGDHVLVPAPVILDAPMTLSAWVRITTGSRYHSIISLAKDDGATEDQDKFAITINNLEQVQVVAQTDVPDLVEALATATLTVNKWHHVVGVITKAAGTYYATAYLDGGNAGNDSGAMVGPVPTSTYVGATPRLNGAIIASCLGQIDQAVIFDQALSASQIHDLWQSQRNGGPGVLGRSTRPMFASSVAGEEVGFNTIYNLTPSPAANDLWTVAP